MNWLKQPLSRRRLYGDLSAEIEEHLAEKVEELVAGGMSPEEAAFAARREFGNVLLIKERSREVWQWPALENFFMDVRYGLRQLRKNPSFTAVAVLTLALGIGATTGIFSVVDAVLLHGTPYQNPAQHVGIGAKSPQGEGESVSAGDFTDWRPQSQTFEGLAAYKQWEFSALTGIGEPDEVWTSPVSTNVSHLLGVNAIIGRTFAENETQVVVLSHEYWHSHFAVSARI